MLLIPLRSSERVYATAKVTAGLIAVNVAIFLYQASLSPRALNEFVTQWGIVPDRLNLASLVTSMFLHGGWLHILGNMLFLWVFGRNVEDLVGGIRYLILYLVCGIAAGVVQIIANPSSNLPTIGASGAIAGIMGAYLIRFPRSHIRSLFWLIFFTTLDIPAAVLLLYWFAIQFVSGFMSLGESDYSGGGVAWFAHVGGFIAGMLLVRLFPDQRKWRAWYSDE
ncbi:MAG TPA: rhomboid family intramembrane serine protease [Bryobacteraceae bacterium]|jgi:membrane associated rhomboid family serine protease